MNTDGTLTSTHCNALQRLQRELCKELCKQSKKVKISELYLRKEDKAWGIVSGYVPPTRATQSRCFGRWRSLPVDRRGHVLLLNYCNETWVSSGCWLARQAVCAMASRY